MPILAEEIDSETNNHGLPEWIKILRGTVSFEPTTVSPDGAQEDSRAIRVPTSYAPASWYDVRHYWTAKNYTYSSYIFEPSYHSNYEWQYFWAEADGRIFSVDVYGEDGNYQFTITSGEHDPAAQFGSDTKLAEPYYVVINNTYPEDGSISSGAFYIVYGQA